MIKWFEKYNKISLIITVLIAGFIFYMSSLTFPPGVGAVFPWKSIVYHFFVFFFLNAFLMISLTKGKSNKFILFLAIILSIAYGISDEVHQLFVLGRYFSLADILTDSAGILVAGLIYSVRIRRITEAQKPF